MSKFKIVVLFNLFLSFILFCQLTTGLRQLYLYKILPEETTFVYEQLEYVPLSDKDIKKWVFQ
ncbi:MAG: hypothetical protein ACK4NF_03200, partial [Planctomycetota bacterium]